MNKIWELNRSLLFMLIFTIVSSSVAFYIVVHAYDDVFEIASSGSLN